MYDYQRFVSYIYAYENEAKSKNVGFAKAEVRNGTCKINVNLKGAYGAGNERLDISCFYQEQRMIHRVLLGSFVLRNGMGEFRYSGEENNLEHSGRGLASFQGIVIQGQNQRHKLYLSMWEDSVIAVSGFLEPPAELSAGLELPKEVQEEPKLRSAEVVFIEVPREEIVEVIKEMPVIEASAEEIETVIQEEPPVQKRQSEEMQQDWYFEERKGTPWEKLRVRFPKVALYYVKEPIEVLRIEPQDIGLLPRENWIFGNNSFLLHGYYNYKHLILAKLGDAYLLGVPGKFINNERFLAKMFGFDSYLSNGENGYWYTEIKIGNNETDKQKEP